jgi:hypothetical protein
MEEAQRVYLAAADKLSNAHIGAGDVGNGGIRDDGLGHISGQSRGGSRTCSRDFSVPNLVENTDRGA